MRFILVKGAKPKDDPYCSCCRREIVNSYVRETSSRRVFCNYYCYSSVITTSFLTPRRHARSMGWRSSP
jgi:hypothetical protein